MTPLHKLLHVALAVNPDTPVAPSPPPPKCSDGMGCMMPEDCPRHGFCLVDANDEVDVELNAPLKSSPQVAPSPPPPVVAWMHNCERDKDCDAEPGAVISAKSKEIWMAVNPKWVAHYTIPLIRADGLAPEAP